MGYIREVVAAVDDLNDGETRQVSVGETDVLLARIGGEFYATGAFCSHYGAPLADGVLEEETGCIVCPWHHAVFDVTSGEHLEPPGRDDLWQFDAIVDGDDVIVEVPEDADGTRLPALCTQTDADQRSFVIVGAGAAGSMAAETLRRHGFEGKITMVTADHDAPYDRPNLSKAFLSGEAAPDWLPLRDESFYDDHAINVVTGRTATRIDQQQHRLHLDGGDHLTYDKLLIASGATPYTLDVPGAAPDGVHLLRSRSDAEAILEELDAAPRVVVIGSSFIGMEVAAALRSRDLQVTVASMDEVPFEGAFGRRVGETFLKLHQSNGVAFELGQGVKRVEGSERVEKVVLTDGAELPADLAVVGIGVHPATDFAASLQLADDGTIAVDQYMKATDNIFAAGDIVRFPEPRTLQRVRIEHWRLANQHGQIAARNMLGHDVPYREVPFFWTRQFGQTFKYVGHAPQWEDIIIHGDLDANDYVAFYVDNQDVLAAAGTRGGDLTYLHALMRHDEMPTADDLVGGFEFPG